MYSFQPLLLPTKIIVFSNLLFTYSDIAQWIGELNFHFLQSAILLFFTHRLTHLELYSAAKILLLLKDVLTYLWVLIFSHSLWAKSLTSSLQLSNPPSPMRENSCMILVLQPAIPQHKKWIFKSLCQMSKSPIFKWKTLFPLLTISPFIPSNAWYYFILILAIPSVNTYGDHKYMSFTYYPPKPSLCAN